MTPGDQRIPSDKRSQPGDQGSCAQPGTLRGTVSGYSPEFIDGSGYLILPLTGTLLSDSLRLSGSGKDRQPAGCGTLYFGRCDCPHLHAEHDVLHRNRTGSRCSSSPLRKRGTACPEIYLFLTCRKNCSGQGVKISLIPTLHRGRYPSNCRGCRSQCSPNTSSSP